MDGLPSELEKKLNKAGGTITGDMRVTGNARMKNLSIEEYLEVPELKYNRITATGNEFWVTDAGVVDDVLDDDDMYVVELRKKEGEITINFQYKDILRGIFYTCVRATPRLGNMAKETNAHLALSCLRSLLRHYHHHQTL